MTQNTYRIKKSLLIPLSIDAVLLLVLLGLSFLIRGSSVERAVLGIILIAILFALFEAFRRTVTIGEEGLEIKKFFKTKVLAWTDITHIGCLLLRRRRYILLTTTRGFYILSNAYDRFSQMVQDLIGHIPPDTIEIEEEARAQGKDTARTISDTIAAWVAAAVLISIIYVKLNT
jgi:hypothetical protein